MSESPPANEHADSISSQDPHAQKTKKAKNRRPANTAFRQQRLKAWQPILTPKTVLPLFFAIGVIFAPLGGVLLWASSLVDEIIIDYTDCLTAPVSSTPTAMPSGSVVWNFKNTPSTPPQALWNRTATEGFNYTYFNGVVANTTQCSITFDVPETMSAPVLVYYRLTNFYQNHRRYVKSFQSDQLKGSAVDNATISSSMCDPLKLDASGKAYYPCGLIANSIFNDTFYNPLLLNSNSTQPQEYVMNNNSGIAWDSDKALYGKTTYDLNSIAVPPNWVKRFPNGYAANPPPDLSQDEAFQVWMRTAGLPTFSKLAMRQDKENMVKGTYRMDVNMNFDVTEYGGTKAIIISTRTVMGGKNNFLGIAYVVVGGLCIVLGALFTVTHLIRPRKLGDHTYLSWNNDVPSTATASGREVRPEA